MVFKTILTNFLFIQHIVKWLSNLYLYIYIDIYIYIKIFYEVYIFIYIYIYIYLIYIDDLPDYQEIVKL